MNKNVRKNIQAYDDTAEMYYEKTKNLLEFDREAFLKLLPKRGKILDLACGPGKDAKIFTENGFSVVGVDLSEESLKIARRIAPKATFRVMDMTELDLNASFDGVWFSAGLLSVEKKFAPTIIENLSNLLRPEGILFISVKKGSGEGFELDKRYGVEKYYAYYTEDELIALLSAFDVLSVETSKLQDTYHTHPWISVICRKK